MAHGFSATKEMYLDDFAEVFAAAGFSVMVYDHRNFGDSDGEPRGEIDPVARIRGYRDAMIWLLDQPGVDRDRIGAWGSSYSGAHVIQLGAIDRCVKCVVSQVPAIDGYRASRAMMRGDMGAVWRHSLRLRRGKHLAQSARASLEAKTGSKSILELH